MQRYVQNLLNAYACKFALAISFTVILLLFLLGMCGGSGSMLGSRGAIEGGRDTGGATEVF
jgi:hypothetical protein